MPQVLASVPPGYSHLQTVDIAVDGPATIVVAWRNNMRGGKTDMGSIACTRSTDGGVTWSTPVTLKACDAETAYGNVVLWQEGSTFTAFIGHNATRASDSENQTLLAMRSADGGATWADMPLDVRYPHPTIHGGHLYKHGDTYLLPFHRNDNRNPRTRMHGVLASNNLTTWDLLGAIPNPDGVFLQEGFIVPNQDASGALLIAMRTDVGYLYTATSADGGTTWTDAAREIALPNHNVKGCFALDANGQYVTIFNTAYDRCILNYKSKPRGGHWTVSRPFTDGLGWNCYTMMTEYAPARFYVVWERNRTEICFDRLDVLPGATPLATR